MSEEDGKEYFWTAAGVALVIFATLAGVGACSLGMGVGSYYANTPSGNQGN